VNRVSLGRSAEEIAATYLEAHGLRTLWKNVRLGMLELDLVMHDEQEGVAVIVEVRSRGPGAFDNPLSSITREKRRFLIRASRALYRERLSRMREVRRVRIDVVAMKKSALIDENPSIEWIKGAITADDW
jgi:putative endonuclease